MSRVDAATGTYCGEGVAEQFGCQAGQLVLGPETAPRYAGFTGEDGSYLSVVPAVQPLSPEGEDLVQAVRDTEAPYPVLVTGQSAVLVDLNGSLQWNVLGLWQQIQTGMRAARAKYGDRIRSIGVDTWGVDFALLGRGDVLLGNLTVMDMVGVNSTGGEIGYWTAPWARARGVATVATRAVARNRSPLTWTSTFGSARRFTNHAGGASVPPFDATTR